MSHLLCSECGQVHPPTPCYDPKVKSKDRMNENYMGIVVAKRCKCLLGLKSLAGERRYVVVSIMVAMMTLSPVARSDTSPVSFAGLSKSCRYLADCR